MIYTSITDDNILLFFNNKHLIASIAFKTRFKLYRYLKLCTIFIDNDFDDFLDDDDFYYNTLTLENTKLIINEYENYLYDFNQHINNIERG